MTGDAAEEGRPVARVVHMKREPYDVYVGRPSKWGNPFSHKQGTLAKFYVPNLNEVLSCFQEWVLGQPELMAALPELQSKVLACWCKPKDGFKGRLLCHGQILAGLAHGVDPRTIE